MTDVTVNGARRPIGAGQTVADLVAELLGLQDGASPAGCAVALNDEVLPRGDWALRAVGDGDRLEVLTAVQGG